MEAELGKIFPSLTKKLVTLETNFGSTYLEKKQPKIFLYGICEFGYDPNIFQKRKEIKF